MKTKRHSNILVFSLLILALLSITIGYASINSVVLEITGKVEASAPKTIFITDVEYVSDIGASKTNSQIINFTNTTMQSKVELSKTNANSEIIYKVKVYNNSDETIEFLDAIHLEENYDNKNITYEILESGFKQGDTITPKEKKDIYIKFKYKNSTIATNNILNSYIKFSIGKPNILKTASNSGDFFNSVARNSIEKISFELGKIPENATQTFDASTNQDKSITGYVTDADKNNLYEITFSSDDIIFANIDSKYLFYNLTKVTNIEFNNFDTSKSADMSYMFNGCSSLTNLSISNFSTSKVTSMQRMFSGCGKLTNIDLSAFNTSNVTNMQGMFSSCSGLTSLNLNSFDTSKVTDMSNMFYYCSNLSNLDISRFNTSKVTSMSYMFCSCSKLASLDVSNFNTSNVTDMSRMFDYCTKLTNLDLNNFNTSKVTNMQGMFWYCSGLTNLDLNSFDTSKVTDMSNMFYYCSSLTNLDLSAFDTSNVTDMSFMFGYCNRLVSLNLSNFDTSNVTNMSYIFLFCSGLTSLDLSCFDTSNVTDMRGMFGYCSELKTIYVSNKFNIDKVIRSDNMFDSCVTLIGGNGTKYNESYVDKTYARLDVSGTPGYFTKPKEKKILKLCPRDTFWGVVNKTNVSTVSFEDTIKNAPSTATDVSELGDGSILCWIDSSYTLHVASNEEIYANPDSSYLFANAYDLQNISFDNFNTSKTENMSYMLAYSTCEVDPVNIISSRGAERYVFVSLNLDISNFDTSNVTDMSGMFLNQGFLTSLDISNFDTSKVTDMSNMFDYCTSLTSLNLNSFDTSNVTGMDRMFYGCLKLKTIYASDKFVTDKVKDSGGMFSGCDSLIGGNGTKFNSSYTDKTYARIDASGTVGYFTLKK